MHGTGDHVAFKRPRGSWLARLWGCIALTGNRQGLSVFGGRLQIGVLVKADPTMSETPISLFECFSAVPDPQGASGKRHPSATKN
jgi:hypothetical protein